MKNSTSLAKVLVNSSIYTFGELLQRGSGFIFLPIYTRYISTAEFGAVTLVSAIGALLSAVFTLHLQAAVVRFSADAAGDFEYLKRLYGTIFVFTGFLSGTLFIISEIFVGRVVRLFDTTGFWYPYIALMLVVAFTSPFYTTLQYIMQAQHKAKVFVIHQSLYYIVGGILSVGLVVGLTAGGVGLLMGTAVSSFLFYLYAWVYVVRNYGICFDRQLLKKCLCYSVPLLPNRFSGLLPSFMDRFILSTQSVALAGTYSVGSRIGEGLANITGGFFRAQLPWFYEKMREGLPARMELARVAYQTIVIVSSLGLLLSLYSKEIIQIVLGADYHDAWLVVPLATFVVVFNHLKEFWLRSLTYNMKGTRYVPIATYTFAGLSVVLTIMFVPRFGMIGAALAILLARIVSSLVMLYFSLKLEHVGFRVFDMYRIVCIAFMLSLVVYVNIPGIFVVKLGLSMVALSFVYASVRDGISLLQGVAKVERSMGT